MLQSRYNDFGARLARDRAGERADARDCVEDGADNAEAPLFTKCKSKYTI